MKNLLKMFVLGITSATFFVSAPSHADRNDVLVIVNDNSVDSPQVGAHYAAQRGVPSTNIVHVRTPNQYFISWLDFQSLRDQILRFGICPSVPVAQRPVACSDTTQVLYTEANINALTAATPIRYVVMTRGVPTQFTVEPATPGYDSLPPVDNYLRFWLARYFSTDSGFYTFKEREKSFGNGDGMRNILPAVDREYAIGRVDGADMAAAIGLIDRTITAEQNGVFGKLFGSAQGDGGLRNWINRNDGTSVYPGDGAPWRYLLGTFNESRPECSDYLSSSHYFAFGQSSTQGRSPEHCMAQFHKGSPNELPPAHSSSRHPMPVDGLMYIGSLDGQTLPGGFGQLLNWRRAKDCVTLCSQASDPVACRAESIDPVKEINTSCVGVAPGFIGYQHQSFPLSYLGIWPTGWTPQAGGGQKMDVPRVDATRGYDDSYSLWFDRTDEAANPQCPVYSNGVLTDSLQVCRSNRVLALRSVTSTNGVNGAAPPSYRLQFRYKTEEIPSATAFTSRLIFVYPKAAGVACPAGYNGAAADTRCTFSSAVNHSLTAGFSNDWLLADRTVTPPPNSDGLNFNAIWLEFVGTLPGGKLGFDTASLTNSSTGAQLLTNGSFSEGHSQTGTGDHAALFLGRLGGTAFWGSTSHHLTNGHAFENNALETLVYFMRGLPLGEAVWFDDDSETGLLYGDPLYSPIAVRINPLNKWNFISQQVAQPLSGSTVNGFGNLVGITYSIHYCAGSDPYLCGSSANPWVSTGIDNQPGKFVNQSLGAWNTSSLAPGAAYTLRLAVTSTYEGKTQTFNDFLPVRIVSQTSDFDGDGLTDKDEIDIYDTDPNRSDSDRDGLTDAQEVLVLHTNPNNYDSDGDKVSDGSEDQDGDGYSNFQEFFAGGDPVDVTSVPLAFVGLPESNNFNVETGIPLSYQFDATWPGAVFKFSEQAYFGPTPSGMSLTSSGLLTWTPNYSQASGAYGEGYYFQMVELSHPNLDKTISQFVVFTMAYGNTGDISEDGVVDVADIALLQRHLLGISSLTARQIARADLAPKDAAPDGTLGIAELQVLTHKVLEE